MKTDGVTLNGSSPNPSPLEKKVRVEKNIFCYFSSVRHENNSKLRMYTPRIQASYTPECQTKCMRIAKVDFRPPHGEPSPCPPHELFSFKSHSFHLKLSSHSLHTQILLSSKFCQILMKNFVSFERHFFKIQVLYASQYAYRKYTSSRFFNVTFLILICFECFLANIEAHAQGYTVYHSVFSTKVFRGHKFEKYFFGF